MERSVVVVPHVAHRAEIVADNKRNGRSQGVEHRLAAGGQRAGLDRVRLNRRLLDAGRQVLKRRVTAVTVVPVIRSILVVVGKLEAEDVIHELHSNVVAEEDDVVARSSVRAEVSLGRLRDARVAHEGRPHEAMHSLVPENSPEGGVVEAREQAHHGLVVMLPDLLRDESSLMLVVHRKTRIHVDLIHKRGGLQEGQLGGLLRSRLRRGGLEQLKVLRVLHMPSRQGDEAQREAQRDGVQRAQRQHL
mmetsp:Transcript_10919/g.25685  ORF Transcript_10919/g.25685 Transcript_10919/m.25685 type:complete len:247 (-) Transcript_10919:2-742(-)